MVISKPNNQFFPFYYLRSFVTQVTNRNLSSVAERRRPQLNKQKIFIAVVKNTLNPPILQHFFF